MIDITPYQFGTWRISVWRFRLAERLKSAPHVKAAALNMQQEADTLESVIDTPPERYTPEQAAWHAWLIDVAHLYATHDLVNDYPGYLRLANAARERRAQHLAACKRLEAQPVRGTMTGANVAAG